MSAVQQEKRKQSIIDWIVTVSFIITMIVIILSMKSLMAVYKEMFISAVVGLIVLFAYVKIQLIRWGKRLSEAEKCTED